MIENYHTAFLHEFAAEIMKRAQEGWKLDMTPAFMPKRHGSAFTCRFVKEESEIKEAVQETLDGLKDAGVYDPYTDEAATEAAHYTLTSSTLEEMQKKYEKPSWSTFGQELIESCEQMNEIIAGEREPSRVTVVGGKTKQELDEMEFTALQEYGRLLGVKDRSRSQLIKKILKTQEEKTDG